MASIALAIVVLAACASQQPGPGLAIAVTVDGAGSVVSQPAGIDCPDSCTKEFGLGATVTLTAAPDAGQRFEGWTGACQGQSETCDLVVDRNKQVAARFAKSPIRVDDASGTTGGDGCTLRDAIIAANTDAAVAGCPAGHEADVIQLPPDAVITFTQAHEDYSGFTALPVVTSEIVVQGAGATIQRDSNDDFRFFAVSPEGDLRLESLNLQGGNSGDADGGAVYVDGGSFSAQDVTFDFNGVGRGRVGGAVFSHGGIVELTNVTMTGSSAPGDSSGAIGTGSAIANRDGMLTVTDSVLTDNGGFGPGERGVIAGLGFDAHTVVTNTVIEDNGALGVYNEGELHMEGGQVRLSASEQLGGIVNSGVAFLSDMTIESNHGELVSGIHNTGFVRLRGSTVRNHSTVIGFTGLRNDGIMEVIDSVIADNDSFGSENVGGGITNSGRLTLVDSQVLRNRADRGGGIRNTGELILIGSVVDANEAAFGGGIHSAGRVQLLAGSVIGGEEGNVVSNQGGGIYVAASAEANLVDLMGGSSIRGNLAGIDGGGIYAQTEFGLTLCDRCSIAQNTADAGVGGGIYAPHVGFGSIYAPAIHDNSPDAVAPGALLVLSIASSQDDAEELKDASASLPAGTVRLDEALLDLPRDAALGAGQYAGLRFAGLDVPAGASVVDARLMFTAAADGDGQTALIVGVEDSVAPAPFTATELDLSGRPRIGSTYWELAPWSVDESGPAQASPSLRNQVQQLIDSLGWLQGNPMAFVLESATDDDSTATRTAHSFDGDPAKAAQLWVLYFDPPSP